MTIVYLACLVVLAAAVVIALFRVEVGPSMLDRAIGVDVVTAALIGFIAVLSVMQDRRDMVAILAALALVGFLSTVAISRFAAAESDVERQVLSLEELEGTLEPERLPDDAAPVHDVDALAAAAAPEPVAPEGAVQETGTAGPPAPESATPEAGGR